MTAEERRAYHREYQRWYRKRSPEVIAAMKAQWAEWMALTPAERKQKRRDQINAWFAAHPGFWEDYRAKHRDQLNESARRRSPRYKEKKQGSTRARYLANPQAEYERTKKKRAADPERYRDLGRRRAARKRGAQGSHTLDQWLARVALHGWRCRYCRSELTEATLTLDHAIPLSRGGTEWPANCVPACGSCNSRKRDKTLTEYLRGR